MSKISVRADVMKSKPYTPGLTIEEIKEKYNLTEVVKLASNENPLGIALSAQKAISDHAAEGFRYPQNGNPALNLAISEHVQIAPENIISGNGSDEIIDLLIRIKAQPYQDEVLTYESCFSMYGLTSRLCGVSFKQVERNEDLTVPLDKLASSATDKTAIIFITSPDNPTGLALNIDQVRDFAKKISPNTIIALDEAYIDFASPKEKYDMRPLLKEFPNIVLLRTFSKAFGLAGLRIGFGVMSDELAGFINRARAPFTVNILAEAAAIAVLKDKEYYEQSLKVNNEGCEFLTTELEKLGCEVTPTQANFIMFKPKQDALFIFEELLKRGVIIRPLKSFGLDGYLRISIGTQKENEIFLKNFKELI